MQMKAAKPLFVATAILVFTGMLVLVLQDRAHAPAESFTTLQGQPVSLDALRGKVVLVNFWSTTCPACAREMPGMAETYERYRDRGFEIVAVAMSYDPPSYVAQFARTRRLPFAVALDVDGSHARAFDNVQLTPTSFLIGRDGRILDKTQGELDFSRLNALLDKALS